VKQVVLCAAPIDLSPESHLYGESFQMLSQTAGTLAKPLDLGYSEKNHYKSRSRKARPPHPAC